MNHCDLILNLVDKYISEREQKHSLATKTTTTGKR